MTDQDKITTLRDALQRVTKYILMREEVHPATDQIHGFNSNTPLLASDIKILALAMTAEASEGATYDPLIARQVAIWRKEVARLQDLIASANGKPEGAADSAADARVQRLLKAATAYAYNYCQDDADLEYMLPMIDGGTREEEAVELFAAIAAMHTTGSGN